jgi:hypothetical protein
LPLLAATARLDAELSGQLGDGVPEASGRRIRTVAPKRMGHNAVTPSAVAADKPLVASSWLAIHCHHKEVTDAEEDV